MADGQSSGLSQPEVDEFEIMRRRVQQQGQRQRQRAQRQTRQQFARLGTLPSGAAIQAEQRAVQAAEQQTGQALQTRLADLRPKGILTSFLVSPPPQFP